MNQNINQASQARRAGVLAGVALTGAGLIAANPVLPGLPGPQRTPVQLAGDTTALADEAGSVWSQLAATTSDNLDALADELSAHPFPVLTALGDDLSGYADTISTALQESSDGLQKVIDGDPSDPERLPGIADLMQTVSADLDDGNTFDAYSALDVFSLEALKFVFKPLAPVLGIPDDMLQDVAHVSHELFGSDTVFDTLEDASRALSSPFIGAVFALNYGVDAGTDTQPADLPAEVLDAFLNGFTYPGQDEPFAGLLTDDGPIDYLFVQLPDEIAAALDPSDPDPTDAATAAADLVG
jgi:hypothetical protein